MGYAISFGVGFLVALVCVRYAHICAMIDEVDEKIARRPR